MRVGIATDHGGLGLQEEFVAELPAPGHDECGAHGLDPADDYPAFVIPPAQAFAARSVERGVAVCSSGVGAPISANQAARIRAALIHHHFSAKQGVGEDMNIICLGGRTLRPAVPGMSSRLSWPPGSLGLISLASLETQACSNVPGKGQ